MLAPHALSFRGLRPWPPD